MPWRLLKKCWPAEWLFLLGLAACGYHVAGRAAGWPANWQVVAVPVFVNRTLQYRIEQRFTQAVVHELLARTRWRVTPEVSGADAVLEGEIVSIESVPLLFDSATGRATTMLVTVQAQVRLKDCKTNRIVYENRHFVLREEYEVSTDPHSFFSEEDPALGRMARDFAARLVAQLIEAH
jgi:outer membrane lipopolysaccharide assembly protein LptE/RlpB